MKNYNIHTKLLILVILIVYNCSSENTTDEKNVIEEPKPTVELPTLETNEAQDIDAIRATIWGNLTNDGGSSVIERGVCYGLNENPTYSDTKQIPTVTKGSGEFKVDISNLEAGLVYYARAYAVNGKGVGYGNQVSFKTLEINVPILDIREVKVAGAHDLFIDIDLTENGDLSIDEVGVVFSTHEAPTIEDNKIVRDEVESSFKQRISNLEPETLYYIRPYAITSSGVSYSNQISMRTIKKGNFTWSFWNEDPNADAETKAAYARIRAAFDEATEYYNNFTSIEKHVNVNFSPGTPTADANFDGWINMGANSSYQKTGTAMHEMAHTVGVGTHAKYWELMKGSWQGARANDILKMMDNNPNGQISGDATHFWPYGINGAHEDTGDSMLYIKHALIIQGMKTDGLPSN